MNVQNNDSISKCRDAASDRRTYLDTMLAIMRIFRAWAMNPNPTHDAVATLLSFADDSAARTDQEVDARTSTYVRVGSNRIPTTPSRYSTPSSKLTPTKRGHKRVESEGDDFLSTRRRLCFGPIVQLKVHERKCARWPVCKRATVWQCQGCHLFLCNTTTKIDLKDAHKKNLQVYMVPDPRNGDNARKFPNMHFIETCFLIEHPSLRRDTP